MRQKNRLGRHQRPPGYYSAPTDLHIGLWILTFVLSAFFRIFRCILESLKRPCQSVGRLVYCLVRNVIAEFNEIMRFTYSESMNSVGRSKEWQGGRSNVKERAMSKKEQCSERGDIEKGATMGKEWQRRRSDKDSGDEGARTRKEQQWGRSDTIRPRTRKEQQQEDPGGRRSDAKKVAWRRNVRPSWSC